MASLGLDLGGSRTASPSKYSAALQRQQRPASSTSNPHSLQEITQSLARTVTRLDSFGAKLTQGADGKGKGLTLQCSSLLRGVVNVHINQVAGPAAKGHVCVQMCPSRPGTA